jgi:hypothetical protein
MNNFKLKVLLAIALLVVATRAHNSSALKPFVRNDSDVSVSSAVNDPETSTRDPRFRGIQHVVKELPTSIIRTTLIFDEDSQNPSSNSSTPNGDLAYTRI